MNMGVLGTGIVGRTLAGKFAELGHGVTVGTRDAGALLRRDEQDDDPFSAWHREHRDVRVAGFDEAARSGELVINATAGTASLDALRTAGAENLDGKILLDVSNPLDFSGGMPPTLSVCNTDSLGEQIQRAFPGARVVKSLNTVNASIMVQPDQVEGEHVMFVSGNEEAAKQEVATILRDGFGWTDLLDLGDIRAARAQEMYLPLWLRLMGALGGPTFNIAIAR